MAFIKNYGSKPTLLKPILIAAVLIIAAVVVYQIGKKTSAKDSSNEVKVQGSGIDPNKSISEVKDVEEVVAKWIENNPEAIIASVQNMQKKAMEEQMQNAQKNIGSKKKELFDDKNSPSYPTSGYNITIVEFFDYSCGYCKKAQATIEQLQKEDKKVRVVYKEFPILGQASEEMAIVALAVNMIDPASYVKFHDAMMKSNARGKEAALKVAFDIGINREKLESTLKEKSVKIAEIIQANRELGSAIGINGTPGFIIGEELIPGALELPALKEKIAEARKK